MMHGTINIKCKNKLILWGFQTSSPGLSDILVHQIFPVFSPLQVGYQIRLKQSRLNPLKTKINLIYMSRSVCTAQ